MALVAIISFKIGAFSNIIGNNDGNGVAIINGSNNNVVIDNIIGSDRSFFFNFGHPNYGVFVAYNSSDNVIGGTGPGQGNIIANNTKGVVIGGSASDTGSVGNSIVSNSIYNNLIIGIDLANDGPTQNHTNNPTPGPNNFQNYPVLGIPSLSHSGFTIPWTLHSRVSSTFLLQFFGNNPFDPEGKVLLQQLTVTTDANGNASGSISLGGMQLGSAITATATYLVGGTTPSDTSEFGRSVLDPNPCPVTCNNQVNYFWT